MENHITIGTKVNQLLIKIRGMKYGTYTLNDFRSESQEEESNSILELLLIASCLISWQEDNNKGISVIATETRTIVNIYNIELEGEATTIVMR